MVTSVIYYIFHKISTNVAPQSVPLKSSLTVKVLCGVDIICQLAVSAGAMVASRTNFGAGRGILLAAIAIHCSNVVGFLTIVIIWQRRVGGKWAPGLNQFTVSVRRDVLAIYVSTGLIVLRNLLRCIEFASGPVSPAALQEYWYVS